MYRGVREKIQNRLRTLGINESEILTTDTHIVNGLVPARLGYHPLGEVIDVQKLVRNVEASAKEAFRNLESCDTASNHTRMKVRILGLRLYKQLTDFVYRTSELVAFSMFPLLIVTLLIFLTYLSKIL